MKNIRFFLSENFMFLEVKISIYLHRRVFVMLISIILTLLSNEYGEMKLCFQWYDELKLCFHEAIRKKKKKKKMRRVTAFPTK